MPPHILATVSLYLKEILKNVPFCVYNFGYPPEFFLQILHDTERENTVHSDHHELTPCRKNENSRRVENTIVTSHGALLPDTSHSSNVMHNKL
jgi:hypothetical protein